MDFYAVLDQILILLRSRGRLSYQALKLQFALDDETLEALKEELRYAQHPVTDEAGRGLVWNGPCDIPPTSALPSPPHPSHSTIPHDQPVQGEAPPVDPRLPDAERRQLTVMFCDLVDSTVLASQLDPEDLREVIRAYQATCAEVIQRYGGYIAQYLGDGLLIYFGYPRAHEDDAQRAARTGLGILDAMVTLNTRLQQARGFELAVRLGIHTGLVVVGQMGAGGRHEQLALGETPNIAARLQGIAEPDTVVLSAATAHLVEGYFRWKDLGPHTLKGVASPLHVYRILSASDARGRLDVAVTRGLTPLVGREQEVQLLLEHWERVKGGLGHGILLRGEAGIGKSRLMQVLKEQVADEPHVWLECRCSPYYRNHALYPVIDLWERLLAFRRNDTPDEKVDKLERLLSRSRLALPEVVPLFAALLSLSLPADRYPPLRLTPQRQRQRTLAALLALVIELTEQQPVVLLVEDLHWSDPSTVEFLSLLMEHGATARFLILLTCRPAFQPPWSSCAHVTSVTLHRLPQPQVQQIVMGVTEGRALPTDLLQHVVAKTDGIPLFVEELTKMVLESGFLRQAHGQYELIGPWPSLAIPATLHDALMARLDRLDSAKAVAQVGSVLGRSFSYELLRAVSPVDEAVLPRELGRLVEAELLFQQGLPPQATYLFKHALIQDAAYYSLLRNTRQQYHQRIAQVLAEQFPDTATTQPELLAHHYTEAGLNEQAVQFWHHAGQYASERSAHMEATGHLTKGLEVLQTLPETPERTHQDLALQILLGQALIAIKGYAAPDVQRTYARAQELCQHIGETPQLFWVLWGLQTFYMVRADLQTAWGLGEQLLRLAQHQHDPALLLEAHYTLGNTLFWRGELVAAQVHLEHSLALYPPEPRRSLLVRRGTDPAVGSLSTMALTLWLLGYPDQALERIHAALTLARELAHPFSLAHALNYAAGLHIVRGEGHLAHERAEATIALATEQGFPHWQAGGAILQGWALTEHGHREQGIAQMRQSIATIQAIGAEVMCSWYLGMLAEAYRQAGQIEAGLTVVAEALGLVEQHGERFGEAELYRLKGELLLRRAQPDESGAETCWQQALDIVRRQQAKSLELRVAMSLSRLWQQRGKCDVARQVLAATYGWFTEGLDTADLQEAKALLEALA